MELQPHEILKETGSGGRRPSKGKWSSKTEFLFSCIGFTVGYNSLLIFPTHVELFGRVTFLAMYLIVMLFVCLPITFMELSWAQFSNSGPVSVWNCLPVAKAIGIVMTLKSAIFSSLFSIAMAIFACFIPFSFSSLAPWNVNNAISPEGNNTMTDCSTCNLTLISNINSGRPNISLSQGIMFSKRIMNETSEMFKFGGMNLPLIMISAINLVLMFLIVKNGSKSIGKAVYYTATIPYLFITILIVKSCTFEGSVDGLMHLLTPKWSEFLNISAWRSACIVAMMNMGMASGAIMVYGSYNKFKNNCLKDAVIITTVDFVTSVFGTVIFYAIAGHLKLKYGISFIQLLQMNVKILGLYLDLINTLPFPSLWCIIFFIMFYFLIIDTTFGYLETVISVLVDEVVYFNKRRTRACILVCLVTFLCIFPLTVQNNIGTSSVFRSMNWCSMVISLLEVTCLMWLYGVKNFSADIEFMLGFKIPLIMKFCWTVLCPLFFAFLLMENVISYRKRIHIKWPEVTYWVLFTVICLLPIAIGVIYSFVSNKMDIKKIFGPNDNWGPSEPYTKNKWKIERSAIPINNMKEEKISSISGAGGEGGNVNPAYVDKHHEREQNSIYY